MPVIGYLSSKDPAAEASVLGPMRDSLAKAGFVEGPNLAIDYRWSEGHYDRLPLQASDLVARKVRLIVTSGFPATLAAKAATSTIPIVFRLAVDPVATKLAASLSRPGGNLTGVTMLFDALTPKKIELLRELVPQGRQIAFLINPRNRNASSHRQHAERASEALGLQLTVVTAGENGEIGPAFDLARQHGAAAILVGDDPFFDVKKAALVDAAGRSRIPTMFYVRDFVEAGGLISYGLSFDEMATLVGKYAARILKGADPAGIPISQPTKIELIINLKAAKTLGLAVPQSLLARADEVIE
ncbi:MAG TPA: ABC transporter substrate-binding protein [Stellaceae bacterium]|nr:ABC transporter substrate-binding protein [Stellaceae bacterium]